ncbi:MAG: Major Facilitator Superfamily protein [Alphaproteobacteria bacterium ADurb.Bin438]|nr:MAG: Major Facilitator Superfamily protein [Alphaproteobacteria bacterium ADurb.Bin438]
MNIYPKKDFNIKDVRASLKPLSIAGVMAKLMDTFCAGTFLIAYALELKASYFEIGILTSLVHFGNLFQIPMAYLIEKYHYRKLLLALSHVVARAGLFATSMLIFFSTKSWVVEALIIIYAIRYFSGRAGAIAWNSMIKDLIPNKIMGSYFANRMKYQISAGIIASLIGAYFIDFWKKSYPENAIYAYSFIIFVGGIFAVINTLIFMKVPEPPMKSSKETEGMSFFVKFQAPFKDKNFIKITKFLCSWNFANNLAIPFFSAFLLKEMDIDLFTISCLNILSQMTNVILLNIWGKIADKYCYKSVLFTTTPLLIFSVFLFIFVDFSQFKPVLTPFLCFIHLLIGMAQAGITLSTTNIALKNAHSQLASTYLSANSIMVSFSSALASIIGGSLIDFLSSHKSFEIKFFGNVFHMTNASSWDLLFVISILFCFISLYFLKKVSEKGETSIKNVLQEFIFIFKNKVKNNIIFRIKYKVASLSPFEYEEIVFIDPINEQKTIKKKRKLKSFKSRKKSS